MDQTAQELEKLILGILYPQEEVRQQAEKRYFEIEAQHPTQYFMALANVLKHSTNARARIFSAVILRQQSLPAKKLLSTVPPEVIQHLKSIAMELFQSEPSAEIRRKVIEFAAIFAARLFKGEKINPSAVWPEILALTFQGAALVAQPEIQVSCFDMLCQIGEYSVEAFAGHEETVLGLVKSGVSDPQVPIQVAIAAANCLLATICSFHVLHREATQPHIEKDQPRIEYLQKAISHFAALIPQVCSVFARALNEKQEGLLSDLISALSTVITVHPSAFSTSFKDLINLVATIARHPDLDTPFCSQCISLLLEFASSPAGRSLIRKTDTFQSTMVQIGFEYLLDIDYTKEWAEDPNYLSQDEEDWARFYLGAYIIKQLPPALGTKTFLTPLLQEVIKRAQMVSQWKQQHAALTVLIAVCEEHIKAIPKPAITTIQAMLASMMDKKFAQTANPRVVVAALQAVAAFAQKLGQKSGKMILPSVLNFLPTDKNAMAALPSTVVYYASRALAILTGLLTPDNLKPSLPAILSSIVATLDHPLSSVVCSALTCLSSVALVFGPDFGPFAGQMMAGLCELIQTRNAEIAQYIAAGCPRDEHNKKLYDQKTTTRNKAVETIGFIAEAIGRDLFLPFAPRAMTLLCEAQELELKSKTPYFEFLHSALTKIADTIQQDFGQYIGAIIPGILHAAGATGFVHRFLLDGDQNLSFQDQQTFEQLEQLGFSSVVVSLHGSGSQRVVVNTSAVQDKIQALEMLGEFALSMKEAFGPYLQRTAQVLFPECTSTQNPRIRWSAATTLPALLECLTNQPGVAVETVQQFFTQCLNAFQLDTWIVKELPEGLSSILHSVTACIDALSHANSQQLPESILTSLGQVVVTAWNVCLERRISIEHDVMHGDEESVEIRAEAMQHENASLDACIALNTELLKTNRDAYMPFFSQYIEPLFAKAIGPENAMVNASGHTIKRDPYLGVCGLVGYADMIGRSGQLATPFVEKLFPIFLHGALDGKDAELRRGCAYGIVATHRALPMASFAPYVPTAIDVLAKCVQIEYTFDEATEEFDEVAEEDCAYSIDNALAGLTDIMTRFGCGFVLESCPHSAAEQANIASIEPYVNPQYIEQYMPLVLEKLARYHDEVEALAIHKNLCIWLTKCPQTVFGKENQNIPHLIRIVAHVLDLAQEYNICDEGDIEILKNTWRSIRTQLPPETLQRVLAAVDPDIAPMLIFE